jgi:hypothetical protein
MRKMVRKSDNSMKTALMLSIHEGNSQYLSSPIHGFNH